MGEQSNRINPSSRQEYERGNFSCTITKNAKEKNEWDDPKEAHPGRLAVPAPGTAQTGTDGGGGGGVVPGRGVHTLRSRASASKHAGQF